jgi:hypothetical protein
MKDTDVRQGSILIQPLPYPQAEALVGVWHTAPGLPGLPGRLGCSPSMYFTYRTGSKIHFEKHQVAVLSGLVRSTRSDAQGFRNLT